MVRAARLVYDDARISERAPPPDGAYGRQQEDQQKVRPLFLQSGQSAKRG
jgi:hypothetical protein